MIVNADSMTIQNTTHSTPKNAKRKVKFLLFFFMLLIGIACFFYFFNLQRSKSRITQQSAESYVQEISTIIDLPLDEKPIFATVANASKVIQDDMFQNAENGDVILFYVESRKTILYRPSEKKIIEVKSFQSPNSQ